jgi:hypothetical protein
MQVWVRQDPFRSCASTGSSEVASRGGQLLCSQTTKSEPSASWMRWKSRGVKRARRLKEEARECGNSRRGGSSRARFHPFSGLGTVRDRPRTRWAPSCDGTPLANMSDTVNTRRAIGEALGAHGGVSASGAAKRSQDFDVIVSDCSTRPRGTVDTRPILSQARRPSLHAASTSTCSSPLHVKVTGRKRASHHRRPSVSGCSSAALASPTFGACVERCGAAAHGAE